MGKDIIGLCKSDAFDSGSIICVWGSPASSIRVFIRKFFSPLRLYLKKYFKTNLYIENPAFHSMGGYVKYVDPDQIKAHID